MVHIPIVNAGQKYVEGLEVSFNSTSVVDIAAGQARDSGNVNDITLSSSVSVDCATNGANGLDSGSLGNNTIYAVYVIGDSTQGQNGAGIVSSDLSSPALPKDYDMYRRVGYIRTDGSANILKFYVFGSGHYRSYWYDVGRSVLTNGTSTSWAKIDLSSDMPSLATQVFLDVAYTPNSATNVAELRSVASGASNGQVRFGYGVAAAQVGMATVPAGLDSGDVKLEYKVANASDDLDILLQGYEDYL